jgi:hypothetical protein
MRPERLAAMQPSRVSASRAMMAQMLREGWRITTRRFEIGADSVGTAVYDIVAPGGTFSFLAYSNAPKREGRTGRIIGRSWDMTGALVEGVADDTIIEATRRELPKLYAGRATPGTLVWCRSNRSMRIFDATVGALGRRAAARSIVAGAGLLPDAQYRPGRQRHLRHPVLPGAGGRPPAAAPFGGADALRLHDAGIRGGPGEPSGALQSPAAVALETERRRFLGIGNGSALGLILFINNHPRLINAWIERAGAGDRRGAIPGAAARRCAAGPVAIPAATGSDRFRQQDRMVYDAFAPSAQIAGELEQVAAMAPRWI